MADLKQLNFKSGMMKFGISPDKKWVILDFVAEPDSPAGAAYGRVMFPVMGLRALRDQIQEILDAHPTIPETPPSPISRQ